MLPFPDCVLHGGEFSGEGNCERSWSTMQAAISRSIGRQRGNQQPIMSHMLTEFEAKVAREVEEIGTAQTVANFSRYITIENKNIWCMFL